MDLRVSLSGAPQCLVRVAGDHCGRHVSESVDCNARLVFFSNAEIGDEPSDLRSEPGLAEPGWFCCTLPSKYGRPCLAAAPPSQAAAACHARCQSPPRRRSRAPAPLSITSNHAQFAPAWCRGNGTVRLCDAVMKAPRKVPTPLSSENAYLRSTYAPSYPTRGP